MKKHIITLSLLFSFFLCSAKNPQEILDQLKQYFRIGLTYSSNALEGNSLTEVETKIVITETDAPHGCFQTLFFCSMATP